MGVVIVGAGSIGLLLASYLAESGLEVTMFVRREEQASLINRQGICRINNDDTEKIVRVQATTDATVFSTARLVVIAVKYAHLHEVILQLVQERVKTPLLFIQNGIGHVDMAKETSSPHVAFATVEHGALKRDDRTVNHNGVGPLTIGAGVGDARKFDLIEQANSPSFPVRRHTDATPILMRKVIINCMINPLTTIFQVKNGELLTNPFHYALFKVLYEELMHAFPQMAAVLPLESVEEVCRNTADNQSSMFVDYLAGRPMEIETIVTAIIKKAHQLHKELPLLEALEQILYTLDGTGGMP